MLRSGRCRSRVPIPSRNGPRGACSGGASGVRIFRELAAGPTRHGRCFRYLAGILDEVGTERTTGFGLNCPPSTPFSPCLPHPRLHPSAAERLGDLAFAALPWQAAMRRFSVRRAARTALLLGLAAVPVVPGQTASPAVQEDEWPLGWEPLESFQGESVETVRENYPDGRLRRLSCYLAGSRGHQALHGPDWTWWPNGAPQGRREMVLGRQEGPATNYYEAGTVESTGQFLADGRHGRWLFYNENGVLKHVREYDQGVPHGQFLVLYRSGATKEEKHFERGLQKGLQTEWGPDGERMREQQFSEGLPHGHARTWDLEGRLLIEEFYERGQPSGKWSRWRENEIQVLEQHYQDGVLHGTETRWRASGTKAFVKTYTEGRLEGPLEAWYRTGQRQMKGEMRAGLRHGRWTYWRPDGTLIESWSGLYEDDVRVSD